MKLQNQKHTIDGIWEVSEEEWKDMEEARVREEFVDNFPRSRTRNNIAKTLIGTATLGAVTFAGDFIYRICTHHYNPNVVSAVSAGMMVLPTLSFPFIEGLYHSKIRKIYDRIKR